MARREGDWFAVPLGEAGYAVGLVARAPKRGKTLFGYFFGPVRSELPPAVGLGGLTPDDAVLVLRFFDKAIESKAWPILASTDGWGREAWPMPEFFMDLMADLSGEYVVIRYSEDDPSKFVGERRLGSRAEAAEYPADTGLYPPAHVEYALRTLFGVTHPEDDDTPEVVVEEGVRHFLLIPRQGVEEILREIRAPSRRGWNARRVGGRDRRRRGVPGGKRVRPS